MLGGWLVRLLIAALIIRLIWGLAASILSAASGPRQVRRPRSMQLVRDPVCGTYIQQSRALKEEDSTSGKTHYFCSEGCRQKFGRRA